MKLYNKIESDFNTKGGFINKLVEYYMSNNIPIDPKGINILGIRSNSTNTATYNDVLIYFRISYSNLMIHICEGTTESSELYLLKPINSKGSAILVPGFYKDLWRLGFHRNKKDHEALIQSSPCTVFRDNNKNKYIDDTTVTDTGMFGINMHRASKFKITDYVGLNSAGCQVYKRATDLERLVEECKYDIESDIQHRFSYLLITESQYNNM